MAAKARYYLKKTNTQANNWLWVVQGKFSWLIGWKEIQSSIQVFSYNRFSGTIQPYKKGYQNADSDAIKRILEALSEDIKEYLIESVNSRS